MKTVFLGGTCNESTWRDELIAILGPSVSAYNPVVPDWTPACQEEEVRQRASSDYCLYVITPKMMGVYSVAEVVDDSNKRPEKTLFCICSYDDSEWSPAQRKSLGQVAKMVKENGGRYFNELEDVAAFLNSAEGE
jgi:hypothetical protein